MLARFYFPIAIAVITWAGQGGAATYTLINPGNLPNTGVFDSAEDVNNTNTVVGLADIERAGSAGFIWQDGLIRNIADLPRGTGAGPATAINDAGQIVGSARVLGGPPSAAARQAYLYDPTDGVVFLGTLPGFADRSQALDVNAAGQVVGRSFAVLDQRAFIWDSTNGMRPLDDPPPGADFSEALAINDQGQVVGRLSGAARNAFFWDAATGGIDFGTLPGGGNSVAYDINNAGQVVGASNSAEAVVRAFLWDSENGMRDLGALRPGGTSWGYGINELGQVVGSARSDAGLRAVIWDEVNGMRDLNELLKRSDPNWTLLEAFAINEEGWIAGFGLLSGRERAFVLAPSSAVVPLPAGMWLLLSGLAVFWGVRRSPRHRPGGQATITGTA